MTSQLHKKLRTTLRKTFSNLVSVADKAVRKVYGQSALTVAIASGLALVGLTGFAFAEGWQGQHTSPSQLVVPASSISADAKPIIRSTTPAKSQSNSQAIRQVAYTTNNANQWATGNQNIGVKTIRRTVRKTETPDGSNNAYSDPFGDRPDRAAAYGVQNPDVAQVPEQATATPATPAPIDAPVLTDVQNMVEVPLPDGVEMPELGATPDSNVSTPSAPVVEPVPVQVPVDNVTPAPIDNVTPAPVDNAVQSPVDSSVQVPADNVTPVPVDKTAPVIEDIPATVPVTQEMTPATPVVPVDSVPATVAPVPSTAPRTVNNAVESTVPAQNIMVPQVTTSEDPRRRMQEHCPPVSSLKPISQITNDIAASEGEFPNECTLGDEPFAGRQFQPVCYSWAAPCLAINPLYFEEPALERYGHSCGTLIQPVVSAAHFVVTVPCLPWLMAIDPPNECQYVLGYYRPGECAPYVLDPIPFSVRAAVVEGGVATALIFLIP